MLPTESATAVARASVLLVDDHALLRTGVANIINQEPDLWVVAEAGNGVEAIDAFISAIQACGSRPSRSSRPRRLRMPRCGVLHSCTFGGTTCTLIQLS